MSNEKNWIGGDGGPMIVLQASAVAQWQGADDFEDSLMNGGDVETDYDVICECDGPEGPPYVIHHNGRNMLVLDDSEWVARLFMLDSGEEAIEQSYGFDDSLPDILERVAQTQPTHSFSMLIQDPLLRLQVGAVNSTGGNYGFQELPVAPGAKRGDVYRFEDGLVVILR